MWRKESAQAGAARRSSCNGLARPLTCYRPRPPSVGWTPKSSVHDPIMPALHSGGCAENRSTRGLEERGFLSHFSENGTSWC